MMSYLLSDLLKLSLEERLVIIEKLIFSVKMEEDLNIFNQP